MNRAAKELKMFVLDVLRHDVAEQVASIRDLLNDYDCVGWRDHWSREFTVKDVEEAVAACVKHGWVEVFVETGEGLMAARGAGRSGASLWYGLTDEGRQVWDRWTPPAEGTVLHPEG